MFFFWINQIIFCYKRVPDCSHEFLKSVIIQSGSKNEFIESIEFTVLIPAIFNASKTDLWCVLNGFWLKHMYSSY